jgi:hypothetical protein
LLEDRTTSCNFYGDAGILKIDVEINGKVIREEVENFIKTIHKKQDPKVRRISEIDDLFGSFLEKIALFNEKNLSFIKNKKLSDEKIIQFVLLSRFTLLEKLILAQNQTKSDLFLIKSVLTGISSGIFNGTYVVDFLNVKIDISDINEIDIHLDNNHQLEINLSDTFKLFAETYILEEFMLKSFNEKMGHIDNFIISKDLESYILSYFGLQSKNIDATLDSEFKGEGGYLNLNIVSKSILNLRKNLIIAVLKASFFALLTIFAVFIFIISGLYTFIPLSIIFAIICFTYISDKIKDHINIIKISKLELKKYGQQQSTY